NPLRGGLSALERGNQLVSVSFQLLNRGTNQTCRLLFGETLSQRDAQPVSVGGRLLQSVELLPEPLRLRLLRIFNLLSLVGQGLKFLQSLTKVGSLSVNLGDLRLSALSVEFLGLLGGLRGLDGFLGLSNLVLRHFALPGALGAATRATGFNQFA